jgi:prophage DNA circulation protein
MQDQPPPGFWEMAWRWLSSADSLRLALVALIAGPTSAAYLAYKFGASINARIRGKQAAGEVTRDEFLALDKRVHTVSQLSDRMESLENRFEAHMRENVQHTEQLSIVREKVAAIGEAVNGSRDKLEDLCERLDRQDEAMGGRVGRMESILERLRDRLLGPPTPEPRA